MAEFASKWPDMRDLAIQRLKTKWPTKKISAERHREMVEQIVVSVVPAQMVTAISRNYLVTVEVWAATKADAFDLCGDAAYEIESMPRRLPIVTAELNAGPNEQRDDVEGDYFYDATVIVTAHRL